MKISWQMIVLGILSIALGYYLNTLANRKSNEKLIAMIKAELETINQNKARTSDPALRAEISLKESELMGQLLCLENKL